MVYERFPVVIDGKPFSTAFQTQDEFASGWKAVLEKAYGRTHAVCRCPGKGERKLAIKRRDETDGFHLARFAGTGPEHANECRYYAPAPERSGMQGYESGVVEEGDDGTLRVRRARGLVELPARIGSAGRDGVIASAEVSMAFVEIETDTGDAARAGHARRFLIEGHDVMTFQGRTLDGSTA
ncbi:DUF1173 family protein [Pseudomonas gingeri]